MSFISPLAAPVCIININRDIGIIKTNAILIIIFKDLSKSDLGFLYIFACDVSFSI